MERMGCGSSLHHRYFVYPENTLRVNWESAPLNDLVWTVVHQNRSVLRSLTVRAALLVGSPFLTIFESMMPVSGKMTTGSRAVMPSGRASVHHNRAIRMMV